MKPLNSLGKRDLLAAKKFDPEIVRAYGEDYFQQERYGEAFEFFRKIGDAEGIRRVKQQAAEMGDPELLWRIANMDAQQVSSADWSQCGEGALRLEKYRSAAFAFARAGYEARRAEAERHFMPESPTPAHSPA